MCNAGVANYNGAAVIAPTVTSESQNVLRSYGNLQQVSYNSKTIDTPYSSVSKHDVRVSNPGFAVAHQPAIAYHSAPAVHGMIPLYLLSSLRVFWLEIEKGKFLSFQLLQFISKAIMHPPPLHTTRIIPLQQVMFALLGYCYCFISKNPSFMFTVVAAPVATLLGVKYSPSTSVSHMSYSAPLISYGELLILRLITFINPPALSFIQLGKVRAANNHHRQGIHIRISGNNKGRDEN
jgi:Pupal cuticle protein C1